MTTPIPRKGLRRRWVFAAGLVVLGLIAAFALWNRTPAPSPRPPEAPPGSASRTQPPPGATACLTEGGVAIRAGDDAQSLVNGHPPGTTYVVKTGTHLRNFSVEPKSGDS